MKRYFCVSGKCKNLFILSSDVTNVYEKECVNILLSNIYGFVPLSSLKECVYKAMHPLISQFVGFQEAEIQPHDNGTATVKLNLKSGAHKQFKTIKAHWRRIDGDYFLTSSSVAMKD